jgi:glutamyl-tRNA reductase
LELWPALRASKASVDAPRLCERCLTIKIGIVGAGKVGSACALAAVVRGSARNIVIVDRTRKRAKAVATDLLYDRRFVQRPKSSTGIMTI